MDIAGVPTPQHMDGRSILPLLRNRHRNVRGKWPDTFLIESSGRRETAEQIEAKAAALARKLANEAHEKSEESDLDDDNDEIEEGENRLEFVIFCSFSTWIFSLFEFPIQTI